MRKIKYLIMIILLLEGCSGINKLKSSKAAETGEVPGTIRLDDISKRNLTSENFNIDKAVIRIKNDNENESLIGNIKFRAPDTFLISLRSKIGMEIVRIYLNKDTVLINDRINRKLFYGKPADIEKKFGINGDLVPLLLGDLLIGNSLNGKVSNECEGGFAEMKVMVGRNDVLYNIDCRKLKVNYAIIKGKAGEEVLSITCRKFIKKDMYFRPSDICIHEMGNDIDILLKIEKFVRADSYIPEFIPGSKYELIEIR